jgi:hypothetical protein
LKEKRQIKLGQVAHLVSERGNAVEDMKIEEVNQLLSFYRQKAADLELQLLQSQIKLNKLIMTQTEPIPATKITKTKSE